ncbi:MAG: Mor transcription activator family protein [Intestinibacter bartlettii]|uniref:Mor transcription activator family protein n=1 Tax=Intestinibacter bartlettii TaxID=261299 RepID=UPI0026F102B5|nr:Mor transcription activator family protein [Intestinibacter bartlettii]MDO5011208.1 Mor transcription activator family protein [Intestinibacter bartlettii]
MKIVNTLAKLIELIITKCGLITPKQFEELMSKVSKEQSYVVGEYTMRNILITCFLFGGSYLYVPTLTTVYKWVRDAEIYRLYKVGNSTKDLALMFNINRRRVHQIIKKRREMEEMKNTDRFVIEVNFSIKEKK